MTYVPHKCETGKSINTDTQWYTVNHLTFNAPKYNTRSQSQEKEKEKTYIIVKSFKSTNANSIMPPIIQDNKKYRIVKYHDI